MRWYTEVLNRCAVVCDQESGAQDTMSSSPFLPLPAGLEIAEVSTIDDLLEVQVASTKERSLCPLCFCPAERRHSQYTRVVADLPCAGFRMKLILHVRKFFCDSVDCPRKIFTERLPCFVEQMPPA